MSSNVSVQQVNSSACQWFLRGRVDETSSIQSIFINSNQFQIGRRPDLSLSLSSQVVSGLHAELDQRDDGLYVRDLKSTNGTYVNGRPVKHEMLLREGDLVQFANVAFRICRHVPSNSDMTIQQGDHAGDQAYSLVQFDKMMSEAAVVPFYQPLVSLEDQRIAGYEALGRSRFFGLQTPREMFVAASQLNMEGELSVMLRMAGLAQGSHLPGLPHLFLNTHPVEVVSFGLLDSLEELRMTHPEQPIVLEIHEAAITETAEMQKLREALSLLDIGLAYDDFGSGQSRLRDLFDVPPDYLKFDMSLIRGIDVATRQQQEFVAGLVRMVSELGIHSVAEGVETDHEHETCRQIGFTIGQGYFYGKPMEARKLLPAAADEVESAVI